MKSLNQLSELQSQVQQIEEWPEVSPLPNLIPKAPGLTAEQAQEMIPGAIREWILDFSHRAQVPNESAAVSAFGSLATVIGRKIGIFPKQNDSFWVPCVFWTAIVARPGERKSSVISFSQKPLDKLESQAGNHHKAESASAQAKKEILKQRIESLKDEIKKATKGQGTKKIEVLEVELQELLQDEQEEPQERRYRTNDATVEKLGELLKGNPQGILVVRDELIGWMKSFEKPGREGDRAFYLEGWDSSGAAFSVDRIGRKRVVIESLCLQVMGGIQPSALESYVRQAVSGGSGDDGFLQRFQLMVYPEPLTEIKWRDERPNLEAFERVQSIFEWLDSYNPSLADGKKHGLRFSPLAQELYKVWSVNLEKKFRLTDDEHPAFVSHLSKYLRLMPALSLLFHMVESAEAGSVGEHVSIEHAQMAVKWCDFLEAHARKVYAIVERKELRDAHALKRRIERGDITDGMKLRDIAHKCWTPFGSDIEAIRSAIQGTLEPFGYCKLGTTKQSTGRPSEIIRINPIFKGTNHVE
jgi:hypothetical protein